MKCKFIEATNISGGGINYGKFAVCEFDQAEWNHRQHVYDDDGSGDIPIFPLLRCQGWGPDHRFVIDLATGEGGMVLPRQGFRAIYELEKHQIWVCPLYEPFLQWLYDQGNVPVESLPSLVQLPEAPSALWGYRRGGTAKPFILGQITGVFQIKGRGCVVTLDPRKILFPPGWKLHPEDQLLVRKMSGGDLKTIASRIEKGTASEKQGIVLRGLSESQVGVGDLLIWMDRVDDKRPVVPADPVETPVAQESVDV